MEKIIISRYDHDDIVDEYIPSEEKHCEEHNETFDLDNAMDIAWELYSEDEGNMFKHMEPLQGMNFHCLETGVELKSMSELAQHFADNFANGSEFRLNVSMKGNHIFVEAVIYNGNLWWEYENYVLDDQPLNTCVECCEHMHRDNTVYPRSYDFDCYCEACAVEYFTRCEHCEEGVMQGETCDCKGDN